MNFLLRSVKIIRPESRHNGMIKDILIRNGIIEKISGSISSGQAGTKVQIIERKGLHVSSGWFDSKANFCDPGFEMKEDIDSGIQAAKAGGFTSVVIMPSVNPVIQSKSDVEYVIHKGTGKGVNLYPVGSLSANGEGKELAEMFDMKTAGALAFTDDMRSVKNGGLMLRALLYAKNMGSFIISFANDQDISGSIRMNESASSVRYGMKGSPAVAEDIAVQRDLMLAEYAGAKIHFSTLSSAGAVQLIRKAKKSGLKVTAEVAAHHLMFDDSVLEEYDTNHKVLPPYRTQPDIRELIKGIADGTIDAICSHHTPQDVESKNVEFDDAHYGTIGLETAFACAHTVLHKKLPLETIISKFTSGPRSVFGIAEPEIAEGAPAELTLFDPQTEWTFTEKEIFSRSRNTPFISKRFVGKAMGMINGTHAFFH